jgi:hypothetical protein
MPWVSAPKRISEMIGCSGLFLSAAEVSWAGEKKVIAETNPKIAKEFVSLIDIAQPFPTNRNK